MSEANVQNTIAIAMRLCRQMVLTCLALAAIRSPMCAATSTAWNLQWEPNQLVNGSAVLFRVNTPATMKSLQGSWSGHQLAFRYDSTCGCWFAIAGVSLETPPGRYPLQLQGTAEDAAASSFTFEVPVVEKKYPVTAITVAPEYVQPPRALLKRIGEEQALKKRLFAEIAPEASWTSPFLPPVESSVTAVFGSARTYNGVKKSSHLGLDFRAAVGTPVHATNRGTVLLARDLYFEGNCVFVDHGQGLVTLYFHLSEIKVKEGEAVTRGQLLGLSGKTGRVTAPHLHFAVRWQGDYLDPETLLALRLLAKSN